MRTKCQFQIQEVSFRWGSAGSVERAERGIRCFMLGQHFPSTNAVCGSQLAEISIRASTSTPALKTF